MGQFDKDKTHPICQLYRGPEGLAAFIFGLQEGKLHFRSRGKPHVPCPIARGKSGQGISALVLSSLPCLLHFQGRVCVYMCVCIYIICVCVCMTEQTALPSTCVQLWQVFCPVLPKAFTKNLVNVKLLVPFCTKASLPLPFPMWPVPAVPSPEPAAPPSQSWKDTEGALPEQPEVSRRGRLLCLS